MALNMLHTVSGMLFILFFFSKVIVHVYLDYKKGRPVIFLFFLAAPLQYFLTYKKADCTELVKMQRICNLLLALSLIALILNIIFGVTIYYEYK